jgi:hypothetical protein
MIQRPIGEWNTSLHAIFFFPVRIDEEVFPGMPPRASKSNNKAELVREDKLSPFAP